MTKKTSVMSILLFLFSALFAETAFPYEADNDLVECKKPKFRKFIPADKSEVAPGSELSFHVTHVVDPHKIELTAKKIPIEVTVEDRNAFYIVRGKLPDSLQGTYARISIKAIAKLGCSARGGWLLKISDAGAPKTKEEVEKKTSEKTGVEAAVKKVDE